MHAIVITDTGRSAAVRLAVRSLRRWHPDASITVVGCDPLCDVVEVEGAPVLAARTFTTAGVRHVDAWGAGGPTFTRWAVVPAAVAAVGIDGPVLVVPDHAWILGALDDVVTATPPVSLGLLPRRHDGASGVSSGGWLPETLVVGARASEVLGWWDRVATASLLGRRGGAVDLHDPWTDFVDAGERIHPITDPTLRLSPASAASIPLDAGAEVASTASHPLRLAQFPGFDPARPWWYSTSDETPPQVLASDSAGLRRLCHAYARELSADQGADAGDSTSPPAEPRVVGIPGGRAFRSAYRDLLRDAHRDGAVPPNPYVPDSVGAFFDWLREPAHDGPTGVSRAADMVWQERPDLARAFPQVRWSHREAFVRWLWTHALREGLITTALLPPLPARPPTVAASTCERRYGVNLVGYHDSDLGLGVAVRRVGAALDAAGIPWTKVVYDRTHSRRRGATRQDVSAPYWFNLILVAPDQLQFLADDIGADFFADHYNIGLWYWETDVMNRRQRDAFDLVDEVWGSTEYLAEVFRANTSKPVAHIPVPLEFASVDVDDDVRRRLGLDDRFTFLFTFDFLSISQRKNPLGLIEAYCRAFAPEDGCRLILKSINGDRNLDESEEIRDVIADRPDIDMWDRYLDGPDRLALVAAADCYVSLHRSEGLGLTMAEAMAAGTPVVATGYSGNLDFMPEGSALLVDHEVVPIGPGSFYPAEGRWAAPDLDHAAELLRKVWTDADLRARLSDAGRRALEPFTVERVGAAIEEHLRSLWT